MIPFDSHPSLAQVAARPMDPPPRHGRGKFAGNVSADWSVIASVFLILALLLSFHQVVQGAVKQGAERNAAAALLAHASRECRAGPTPATGERCAQKLIAPPSDPVVQTAFFDGF